MNIPSDMMFEHGKYVSSKKNAYMTVVNDINPSMVFEDCKFLSRKQNCYNTFRRLFFDGEKGIELGISTEATIT